MPNLRFASKIAQSDEPKPKTHQNRHFGLWMVNLRREITPRVIIFTSLRLVCAKSACMNPKGSGKQADFSLSLVLSFSFSCARVKRERKYNPKPTKITSFSANIGNSVSFCVLGLF